MFASPGLPERRRDLCFAAVLGCEAPDAWRGQIEQHVVRGSLFMDEVVFHHPDSRSVLLGDLIENHEPATLGPVHSVFARANRMLAPAGETPLNYRMSFLRRAQTRADLERVIAWRPEQVIMLHGRIVERGAGTFLQRAFRWVGLRDRT